MPHSIRGTAGFTELVKPANEYIYDGNGNELRDQNSGLSSISYNILNLPQTIVKDDGSTVVYIYSATGNKLRKLFTAGGTTTTTEYDNGIQYDNSATTVSFIQTEEGRARHSGTAYIYEYDLKDHLGNTRVTLTPDPADPTQQTAKILQENDYYAFGYGIQSMQPATSPKNEYLYNHKELQEETGLYDYGARFYDPVIGRWTTVDPLAEISRRWTPYNYGSNNPVNRIDPDGMTDFTFNKKTGEVSQVGEKNDDPDRIVRTNRKGEVVRNKKGEAKVAVGGIEKGILKDGQNWRDKDQVISVGGKGQPSVEGVKSFTLNLSEYLGNEIKGYSYSSDGSKNVTDMVLGGYKNNTLTSSQGSVRELLLKYGAKFSFNNILQDFHTHPNGELGATQSAPGLSQDVTGLQSDKPQIPNATFIILYRIQNQATPAEYDYTHEYIPKSKK